MDVVIGDDLKVYEILIKFLVIVIDNQFDVNIVYGKVNYNYIVQF